MNPPCKKDNKDCPDRYVNTETGQTCHSTCEKYLAFRKYKEAEYERRRRESLSKPYYYPKRRK